jgi:hypothetical protein
MLQRADDIAKEGTSESPSGPVATAIKGIGHGELLLKLGSFCNFESVSSG